MTAHASLRVETFAFSDLLRLVGIALLMTVGVYGLVAGIVKLDDLGLYLARQPVRLLRALGKHIVGTAPYLMKTLAIAGTAAMFLFGGGILTHGVPVLRHAIANLGEGLDDLPGVGAVFGALGPMLASALAGVVAGGVVFAVVTLVKRLRTPARSQAR